jgi:hypothetical protein
MLLGSYRVTADIELGSATNEEDIARAHQIALSHCYQGIDFSRKHRRLD